MGDTLGGHSVVQWRRASNTRKPIKIKITTKTRQKTTTFQQRKQRKVNVVVVILLFFQAWISGGHRTDWYFSILFFLTWYSGTSPTTPCPMPSVLARTRPNRPTDIKTQVVNYLLPQSVQSTIDATQLVVCLPVGFSFSFLSTNKNDDVIHTQLEMDSGRQGKWEGKKDKKIQTSDSLAVLNSYYLLV